ncbi:MAG TPA: RNA polymerase sigma factor [Saprospiraceae bacterium]|nr:RNA polymerase sigma factor [Saprospiraceae bacterium]
MDIVLQQRFDETTFIEACINNERWAQKKLYEDNYSTMMTLALRYANCNDDALDILHEGFIKVFKNMYKYHVGTSLQAWIKRIIINTAIDYYRKEVRRKEEDLELAYNVSSNEPDAISNMSSEEILKALQQLSYSYRSVFNLYVIEGYSHKEIGEMMHITESTCRSNLVKARTKLKNILLGDDENVR